MLGIKRAIKEVENTFRDAAALMRGNFLVLTIGFSLWSSFWAIFYPFEGYYILALGGTYIAIGAFYGVCNLVRAMAGILGGYICDTYGRRKIIVRGNYMTALVLFIIALAPNWQFYFAATALLSLAAFWTVAENVILMDSMPIGKRGLGYGLSGTIVGLTSLASPYIGGWIFETYHAPAMRFVLFSVASADAIKAMLYTRWLKETLEPKEERKSMTPDLKNILGLTARSFAETFRTLKWLPRALLGFCALIALYSFAWYLVGAFFIFYAMDVVSLTLVEWGLIYMIQQGVSLSLRFPGGRLADRCSKRLAILVSCGVEVPFFIGFIYSRSYIHVLAVLVSWTAVQALTGPAWNALQVDLTPREMRGKVSSLFGIVGASFGLFGSILGGYLYTLNPAFPFWVYVFLAVAGTSIAFMIIHEPEKPEV